MWEQIQAGLCQDITNAIDGNFKDSFYPAGLNAFIVEGKLYGLPDSVGPIVFWYTQMKGIHFHSKKSAAGRPMPDSATLVYWTLQGFHR